MCRHVSVFCGPTAIRIGRCTLYRCYKCPFARGLSPLRGGRSFPLCEAGPSPFVWGPVFPPLRIPGGPLMGDQETRGACIRTSLSPPDAVYPTYDQGAGLVGPYIIDRLSLVLRCLYITREALRHYNLTSPASDGFLLAYKTFFHAPLYASFFFSGLLCFPSRLCGKRGWVSHCQLK
jgi:hypothetical protein